MLVLGDGKGYLEGVGKTTLIQSLVSETFPENVPQVSNPIRVPLDGTNTDRIATIVDTACESHSDRREEDGDGSIEEELQKADVVLLLYEILRTETMQRIASYWMPRIAAISASPVIFVGTKADLRQANSQHADEFEDNMRALVRDNKQCEAMIECSAKSLLNVSDLFYCAQRLVMYPSAPLFNSLTRELTPAYVRALKFIFRRVDEDKDQLLSRKELRRMNARVFSNETSEVETDQIIDLVGRECPEGVGEEGLNFDGFLHLIKLMILRLKMQFCWVLLRHFGFSDALTLEVNCTVQKPSGKSVKLTKAAFRFLADVFFENSSEGVMVYEGLKEVFGACVSPPWALQRRDEAVWASYDKFIRTTGDLGLTLTSWLSLWWLLVWSDHVNAYKYLWLIGLQMDAEKTFYIDTAKSPCVYVLGVSGSGKTSLLESFIRKPFKEETYPTSSVRCVCDVVQEGRELWQHQFLIVSSRQLKEVPQVELEALLKTAQCEEECCLVCLLSDASQASAAFLRHPLLGYFRSGIPKVVIRTKSDQSRSLDIPADRSIELSRLRPSALFGDLLAQCQLEEPPSGREAVFSNLISLSILVLGAVAVVWFFKRRAIR